VRGIQGEDRRAVVGLSRSKVHWMSAPSQRNVAGSAGAACSRVFARDDLSVLACRMLRLLAGDSSVSVRMASRSSLAEITGNNMTSRHPRASTHCKEPNGWSVPSLLDLRQSQQAGKASSSHARFSSNSIEENDNLANTHSQASFPESASGSQCDFRVLRPRQVSCEPAFLSMEPAASLWESRSKLTIGWGKS